MDLTTALSLLLINFFLVFCFLPQLPFDLHRELKIFCIMHLVGIMEIQINCSVVGDMTSFKLHSLYASYNRGSDTHAFVHHHTKLLYILRNLTDFHITAH